MSASRRIAGPSPGRRRWWALAACCFGLFMVLLDVTVVNVALPVIQKDLGASFSDLQWVIDAYTLALAVFVVTSGRVGDIFGRKKVFMTGLAVFTVGSFLCGLSGHLSFAGLSHVDLLLVARGIQGVGGSVMLPVSLAIVSATFEGPQRATAIGIWGGVSGLATAVGPVVGGFLVEKVSWESIFYINIPVGAAGILLSAWAIRETRDERAPRSIDLFGLVTVTVGLFCLVLALIRGQDRGWTSSYIVSLFVVAAIALVAFVAGELRMKNPMVDPRLFRNRSFTGAAIAAFTLSAGLYSLFLYLTLYLQNALGFSALETGLRLLPLSGLVLFTAPLAGNLSGRFSPRPVLFCGMALLAVAAFLMTRISPRDTASDWVVLLPAFVVAGLGNGLVNAPISTTAVGTVPRRLSGMASGVNNVCRQVGTAFGVALWGAILTNRYDDYVRQKIQNLNAPHLTGQVKQKIIQGVQDAGTTAGSTGLKGAPPRFEQLPFFGEVQRIARASFIDGTVDIFRLAAFMLALGAIASVLLVHGSDLEGQTRGEKRRGGLDPLLGGVALAYLSHRLESADGNSPQLVSAAARLVPESEGSEEERARIAGRDLVRPLAVRMLLEALRRRQGPGGTG
ncbi:MAG: MFS transporter [Rubrobacteraceae bacterium]|nr:MFS transporter [Rubrobacteraceae bacterium]